MTRFWAAALKRMQGQEGNTQMHALSQIGTSCGPLTVAWLLSRLICYICLSMQCEIDFYCDSSPVIGWQRVCWWLYGDSHSLFKHWVCVCVLCGFGCIRWLKCGDRMYLFTVGSVLVFVMTQRMGAYWKVMCGMCHVCNVYDCVFVRFQPGSLKPTRMWPRWVSSKPRCASSRRGSPCLSLESLISLPSKFYHS